MYRSVDCDSPKNYTNEIRSNIIIIFFLSSIPDVDKIERPRNPRAGANIFEILTFRYRHHELKRLSRYIVNRLINYNAHSYCICKCFN